MIDNFPFEQEFCCCGDWFKISDSRFHGNGDSLEMHHVRPGCHFVKERGNDAAMRETIEATKMVGDATMTVTPVI